MTQGASQAIDENHDPRIAVLVPCYNEEAAVAKVVSDFRQALPGAVIFVYDNNSRDETSARARDAGAVVRREERQGKGNVVRRMFADVEADIYVLVDGDDTYDAEAAPRMIRQAIEKRRRPADGAPHSYRRGCLPARAMCWVTACSPA